jgi:hypothetical protein
MSAVSSVKLTPQYGRSLDQVISLFRQGKNEEAKALFKQELPRPLKCKIYHKLWETQRILFNAQWGRMSFHDKEFRKLTADQKIQGVEHYLCEELEPLLKQVTYLFHQGANQEAKTLFSQVGKLSKTVEEGIYQTLGRNQTYSGKAAFYDLLGFNASCKEKAKAIEKFLEERNYRSTLETLYDWRRETIRKKVSRKSEHNLDTRIFLLSDWVPTLYAEAMDPRKKSLKVAMLNHKMHPSYRKREEVERIVRKVNTLEFKKNILRVLKVKRVEGIVWIDIKIDAEGLNWYVKMPNQSEWISVPKKTFSFIPNSKSFIALKMGQSIDISVRKMFFQCYHDKKWFLEDYRNAYKKRYFDPYAASDLFKQQRKRDKLNLKLLKEWKGNHLAKHRYLLKIPLIIARSFAMLLRGIENEEREKGLLDCRKDFRCMISLLPYNETLQSTWDSKKCKIEKKFKWKRINESFIHPYRSV